MIMGKNVLHVVHTLPNVANLKNRVALFDQDFKIMQHYDVVTRNYKGGRKILQEEL